MCGFWGDEYDMDRNFVLDETYDFITPFFLKGYDDR